MPDLPWPPARALLEAQPPVVQKHLGGPVLRFVVHLVAVFDPVPEVQVLQPPPLTQLDLLENAEHPKAAFFFIKTTSTKIFFVQGIELKEVLEELADDVDEFDARALLFERIVDDYFEKFLIFAFLHLLDSDIFFINFNV